MIPNFSWATCAFSRPDNLRSPLYIKIVKRHHGHDIQNAFFAISFKTLIAILANLLDKVTYIMTIFLSVTTS